MQEKTKRQMENQTLTENDMETYRKTIDKLVKNSFAILDNKKIKIKESKNVGLTSKISDWFFWYRISVHPRIKVIQNDAPIGMIGMFAHELSHAEIWHKRGFIKAEFIRTLISLSKKINAREEKVTDMYAILKGYGEELISYKKSRWKLEDKSFKKFKHLYLDPDQTEQYVRRCEKLNEDEKKRLMDQIIKTNKTEI